MKEHGFASGVWVPSGSGLGTKETHNKRADVLEDMGVQHHFVTQPVFLPPLPQWFQSFQKDAKKVFASMTHLGLPHTDVSTKSPYWKGEHHMPVRMRPELEAVAHSRANGKIFKKDITPDPEHHRPLLYHWSPGPAW
eukprot:CAMPEP_0168623646 /NCGR_PEP_ID=MMETSP0449_2-20121227/8942_1 /TAXON_ID=1082188 /ORGANISM="Strombidium rassoulzadegani, Strain ras09" /LENGTH=136 /DNA_ID=CAMNT_0008665053 /DNA_START=173 /DNA_END=580 /DNA_ORIENTATION=-